MSLVCLFLRRNYSNYHTLHSHCRSGNKSLNLRIHHRRNQGCYIHWHNYFHSRFRSLHRFLPGNRVNYMKAIGSWHLILRLIEPVLEVQMMWLILRTGIIYHPSSKVWVQDELLRRRMTWVLMAKTPRLYWSLSKGQLTNSDVREDRSLTSSLTFPWLTRGCHCLRDLIDCYRGAV